MVDRQRRDSGFEMSKVLSGTAPPVGIEWSARLRRLPQSYARTGSRWCSK